MLLLLYWMCWMSKHSKYSPHQVYGKWTALIYNVSTHLSNQSIAYYKCHSPTDAKHVFMQCFLSTSNPFLTHSHTHALIRSQGSSNWQMTHSTTCCVLFFRKAQTKKPTQFWLEKNIAVWDLITWSLLLNTLGSGVLKLWNFRDIWTVLDYSHL